ncbi:MAG: hypothetical protein ACR2K5_13395 [Pseudolabrys sp.]
MRFELRQQGPAEACGKNCRLWISAKGAITNETPRDFAKFIEGRDLRGATVALDSDGGSVRGAIALGRAIRRLELATTVGRVMDIRSDDASAGRANLSPRADCESMCTFLLLAGVRRHVPVEARVMVHQIWLGDRREDPTAATYSAEDLVLVQRDIGRLAQFVSDMGGPSELLELALRIPPWEPMHALSRDELRRMKLDTDEAPLSAQPRASGATASIAVLPATDGLRTSAVSERRWQMVDNSGASVLARRHPLTVEGDEIGIFNLMVACGGADGYVVSYSEKRHGGSRQTIGLVNTVTLRSAGNFATLKVVSSERHADSGEIETFATGTVPAAMIKGFAGSGAHSLMVTTASDGLITAIRLGNTGAGQILPALSASCEKAAGNNRAELTAPKTGGFASRR